MASVRSGTLLVALILASALPATADEPARAPVATVEVVSPHAPIVSRPVRGATRRGTLAFRTRLPAFGRILGEGCASGAYVDLGERRFVCEDYVAVTAEPLWSVPQPVVREGELLPFRYAFLRYDGTPTYARPEDYFVGDYLESLGEGFGLVVTGQRVVDGIGFLRLRRGSYVTDDAVRFARGSDFTGLVLAPDEARSLAWIRGRDVAVRARANGGRVLGRRGRREVVVVAAIEGASARLEGGGYVRLVELNRIERPALPTDLAPEERWIDVSISQQVLVAYEGPTPVFATLVSTGADRPGSLTPIGEFRVWAKLATSDMDDLERLDVQSNYLIEGVPWVQYFEGSNALHAAFWHDDFGTRRSHGCVNLSPADARFLFAFTAPVLPDGYEALIPFTDEARTRIRVRP